MTRLRSLYVSVLFVLRDWFICSFRGHDAISITNPRNNEPGILCVRCGRWETTR